MKVQLRQCTDFQDAFVAIGGARLDGATSIAVDDQGDFKMLSIAQHVARGVSPWPERGRVVNLSVALGTRVLSTMGWRARVDDTAGLEDCNVSVGHFVCAPAEWTDVERGDAAAG